MADPSDCLHPTLTFGVPFKNLVGLALSALKLLALVGWGPFNRGPDNVPVAVNYSMQGVLMRILTSVYEIQMYSRSKEVCRFDPSISIDFEFITTILWSYFY